jgi:DNA invertase Pin-like site-specific DNA recombinase
MSEIKVTAEHLKRDAYLYVRQSTLRQVAENGESTQRQYALRHRAIAAGWPPERVRVIDCDLGKSGATASMRNGFQELVSEVVLGKAGIVMGLEVSRLARNSADWHRLIELCALTATLILDEDGIYDPAGFNDRLLLGLKGTMSEAELHILKARMRGGQLNKARRGELEMGPPVGLMYRADGVLDLDPDAQVQAAIRLVFETFERTGSAIKTVRFFRDQGILFPRRLRSGPDKGELLWALPQHSRMLQVLHNPRYAGAFVYGRQRTRRRPDGSTRMQVLPRSEWQFVIPGAHRGYIDWERFEANQQRLLDNSRAYGIQRRSGPVREGPALLQGRVLCGLCGERMGVHYSREHGRIVPVYVCQESTVRRGGKICQSIPGKIVDPAIGALLIELMTPMTLGVTLAVQRELEARTAETDALRRQHLERLRYEADLARRRFMKVDPDNRLVADALEAEWNEKLRLHTDALTDYERRSRDRIAALDAQARQRILDLANQFPAVWNDPRVEPRERKRILRLLVDDVTLIKTEVITAHVRLRGGDTRTLRLDRPVPIAQIRKFKPDLVAEVDRLLDRHCDRQIADILNQRGCGRGRESPST